MNNEQQKLLDEQKKLQEQMNELYEKITNCDKPKMFPQEGEKYWTFDSYGNVNINNTSDSNGRLNAYKTKQEAEKARDIQLAKQRVAHTIAIRNDGWIPDWNADKDKKYHSYLYKGELAITYYSYSRQLPNNMYCKTEEIVKQIIAEHEEDLLLIFSE